MMKQNEHQITTGLSTFITKGLNGWQAGFTIGVQTFYLQPVSANQGDEEDTEEKAKWYQKALETAFKNINAQSPSGVDILVKALEKIRDEYSHRRHVQLLATEALAQYNVVEPEKWKSVEDKRYLLIDGNAYYSLVFDQWNDGDFEADNIDGSYRVLISKNESGYFVANAVDGWGNNSKDHFKDSKVILLNPINPQSPQTPIDREPEEVAEEELQDLLWNNSCTAGAMEEVIKSLKSKYHITRK